MTYPTRSLSGVGYGWYFLLGQCGPGGAAVVYRWSHAPSAHEVRKAISECPPAYEAFLLVSPSGGLIEGNVIHSVVVGSGGPGYTLGP
jgi:hypothetical protein